MAKKSTLLCSRCGFQNKDLGGKTCASCGAPREDRELGTAAGSERLASAASPFSPVWFLIALGIIVVLTCAVLIGLPRVVPVFDFEGSAGMMVAIPLWFVGGLLVGLISPGKTLAEPVLAVLLIAGPTAYLLHQGQTVKTMPPFMYVLFSLLGLLFTLIGAYAGERLARDAAEGSQSAT